MKQILLLKIERFLMKEEFKNARLYLYLMVDVVVQSNMCIGTDTKNK